MIEFFNAWYSPANKERKMHVYLPDDYYFTAERYPVMYMFDGHNLYYDSHATYGTCWGLKEFLDSWEKKIIIVGMECSHEGNERLREYCPYHWDSFAGPIDGIGQQTMDWIVCELKPLIDQKYRTWTHREATGIGGSSMGGLMSLYAAICHNDIFSKAACLSSAVSFCGKELRAAIAENNINPDTKVFLSWGASEARSPRGKAIANSCNRSINDHLYKKGAQPYMYRQTDGHHCEADWGKQIPLFMNWLWLNRI
ncbi:MAG: alpha/beta hydrolase [Alphaproteobacteria bacterium]|nr:alpha/beta hydrolase [Alphaproteobacteria bacterium]